jgi:hypothetical protein
MTIRRRRWLRRLTIGVSLAVFAAPAAAKPTPSATSMQIVSIDSGAIVDRTVAPQQSTALRPDDRSDRFAVGQQTQLASNAVRPDDRADRFAGLQQTQLASNAVRPDDRADRFAISNGASPATSTSNTSVSWDGAVTLGLGTLVLVLALGLGIGYVRRPRIAGL